MTCLPASRFPQSGTPYLLRYVTWVYFDRACSSEALPPHVYFCPGHLPVMLFSGCPATGVSWYCLPCVFCASSLSSPVVQPGRRRPTQSPSLVPPLCPARALFACVFSSSDPSRTEIPSGRCHPPRSSYLVSPLCLACALSACVFSSPPGPPWARGARTQPPSPEGGVVRAVSSAPLIRVLVRLSRHASALRTKLL